MKRFAVLMLFSLLLLPWTACAENIDKGMEAAVDQLELGELDQLLDSLGEPFASQGLRETLLKIARGEWTLSMDVLLKLVGQRFLNVLTGSWWRITRLLAPALAVGICNALGQEKHGAKVAGYGCFLLVAAFMVRDLIDQAKLAADTVERMSGGMQHLFPILLTLLAAVGGSNGSALFQPAVVAAAGTMTTAAAGHLVGIGFYGRSSGGRKSLLASGFAAAYGGNVDAGHLLYGVPWGDRDAGTWRISVGRRDHPHR